MLLLVAAEAKLFSSEADLFFGLLPVVVTVQVAVEVPDLLFGLLVVWVAGCLFVLVPVLVVAVAGEGPDLFFFFLVIGMLVVGELNMVRTAESFLDGLLLFLFSLFPTAV